MDINFSNPFKSTLTSAMTDGVKLYARYQGIVNDQDEQAAYDATNHDVWGEGEKWLQKTKELMNKSATICDSARSVGCKPDTGTDDLTAKIEGMVNGVISKMEELRKRASVWEAGREEREKAARLAEEKAREEREAREAEERARGAREAMEAEERRREALREIQEETEAARLAQVRPKRGDRQLPEAQAKCSRCAARDEVCVVRRDNRACERCKANRQSCNLSSGPRVTKYRAVAKSGQDKPTSRISATARDVSTVVVPAYTSRASGSRARATNPLSGKRSRFAPNDDNADDNDNDDNYNDDNDNDNDNDSDNRDGDMTDLDVAIRVTAAAIQKMKRVKGEMEAEEEKRMKVMEEVMLRERERMTMWKARKNALAAADEALRRIATFWDNHARQIRT